MPIYEYRCECCAHEQEKLAKHDAEPPKCTQCAGKTKKMVSRSSFSLQGSGWYRDGYGLHQNSSENG